MISIVIPAWRDDAALHQTLTSLRGAPAVREIIVALAEASLGEVERVQAAGAVCVSAGAPSRGRQLDLGASVASGEWLLFHHVDTHLQAAHLQALAALHDQPRIVGGAFYRKFDERHPWLRWLEPVERWHNRSFGALYGDQSIFVRRTQFQALGGFRGLPLMEDVDFTLRLRRSGELALLDPPITSSPRKHLTHGPWRTTCANTLLLALFRCGVSPHRLHAWYYRKSPAALVGSTPLDPRPLGAPEVS